MAEEINRAETEEIKIDLDGLLQNETLGINKEIENLQKMLNQCLTEIENISRQNEKINMELQQEISRSSDPQVLSVSNKYSDVLNVQQRLILMRGQQEKIKSQLDQLIGQIMNSVIR